MNLQEFEKQQYKKMSFWRKVQWNWYTFYFKCEHWFRRITKICPHDSSFGAVGGKMHVCLDCMREI